ncbi:phosphatidylglycerol lysyltransferase domain-containing protein [Rhodococcus sp. X156]|uniref:bifunctional lysylphosphatidylglycerol flippase/synthetase MprF n=1 Tax=Rhodococcus sp. X156 TaxID=2499145 RepID=UPI000FD9751A|nr:phosphatidylglycerol lysyltransferase domain-containing protein [Rhodococcus sp. X156]
MSGLASFLDTTQDQTVGRLGDLQWSWPYALGLAIFFLLRGLYLRRPLTRNHVLGAVALAVIARLAYDSGRGVLGFIALALAGAVLVFPKTTKAAPEELGRVFALVNRSRDDPLAPFVMHSAKGYFFNSDGTAALGYRARLGIAAVAGDPVGERTDFADLIEEFQAHCRSNGWRVAVLAAGEYCAPLWSRHGLRTVPIGRDVVIDVASFTLQGRQWRNLRQAVQRTHNAGITTEVRSERGLDKETLAELRRLVASSDHRHANRGFSMILDHLLDGRTPGILLAIARDAEGRAVAFHRYATADEGRMLTLDVPYRSADAPNGVDERLSVDMVHHGKEHGGEKVSLAFAAFPEIFESTHRGAGQQAVYVATHLLDPLIRIESLYRFVRKFRALDGQRFAMVRLRQVAFVLAAFLVLEFVPHRRRS